MSSKGQVKGVKSGAWTFSGNPNGIASHSPRLPYSATLGRRIAMGPNPKGVAPLAPRTMNNETRRRCVPATVGRNPFRVVTDDRLDLGAAPSPRVAEYSNPGLRDVTPSGLHCAG